MLGKALPLALAAALCPGVQAAPAASSEADGASAMQPARLIGAQEYTLRSRHTGRTYRIQVAATGPQPAGGYPVLYVLDGDALFPVMATAAQGMMMRARENGANPLLVVGVGYPSASLLDMAARTEDYTPPSESYRDTGDRMNRRFGGADRFRHFLQAELPADLARRFRINTGWQSLFGHSYGGLFSLHTLLSQPGTFRNYLIASPSIWWNQQRVLQDWPQFPQRLEVLKQPPGVRLSVGEYEEKPAPHQQADPARQAMLEKRGMVRETAAMGKRLATLPNKQLDASTRVYAGETHATSVLPAMLDGLRWLYARCQADPQCAPAPGPAAAPAAARP